MMKYISLPLFVILILFSGNLYAQANKNVCKPIKVCPDTIVGLSKYMRDTTKLKQQIRDFKELPAKIIEVPIKNDFDSFLNLKDTTIFTSNFKELSLQEIHPRSLDYYQLVKNIHDLNSILTNISNAKVSQLNQIKTDLEQARLLIETINSFTKVEKRKVADFLTEEQKQYYRSLVNRYNELYSQINSSK